MNAGCLPTTAYRFLMCFSFPKQSTPPTACVQVLIIWPNAKSERDRAGTLLGHRNLTRTKKSFWSSWASAALCCRGYSNGAGQDLSVEDGRGCKLVFNFTKRGFGLSQDVFPPTPVHHNYRPVARQKSPNERSGGDGRRRYYGSCSNCYDFCDISDGVKE